MFVYLVACAVTLRVRWGKNHYLLRSRSCLPISSSILLVSGGCSVLTPHKPTGIGYQNPLPVPILSTLKSVVTVTACRISKIPGRTGAAATYVAAFSNHIFTTFYRTGGRGSRHGPFALLDPLLSNVFSLDSEFNMLLHITTIKATLNDTKSRYRAESAKNNALTDCTDYKNIVPL